MLKALSPLIGAALLATTTALYAQATPAPADAGKGAPRARHFDCSQAKDPKACEERLEASREKTRAAHEKAAKACEGQKGDAQRDCVRKSMCAESKDPAKCEARAQKHKQRREQRDKK